MLLPENHIDQGIQKAVEEARVGLVDNRMDFLPEEVSLNQNLQQLSSHIQGSQV